MSIISELKISSLCLFRHYGSLQTHGFSYSAEVTHILERILNICLVQFMRSEESEYALRVLAGEQTIWYSPRVLVALGKVYAYQIPLLWFPQTMTVAFQSALHFFEPSLTYPAYSANLRVFQSSLSRSHLTEVTVDDSGVSMLPQGNWSLHCTAARGVPGTAVVTTQALATAKSDHGV
jgi:hypothetical protein